MQCVTLLLCVRTTWWMLLSLDKKSILWLTAFIWSIKSYENNANQPHWVTPINDLCQDDWFIITVWKFDRCNLLFDKFMFPRCCYTFLFLDWGTQWDILLNKFGKIPSCCDLEVKWYGIKNKQDRKKWMKKGNWRTWYRVTQDFTG